MIPEAVTLAPGAVVEGRCRGLTEGACAASAGGERAKVWGGFKGPQTGWKEKGIKKEAAATIRDRISKRMDICFLPASVLLRPGMPPWTLPPKTVK